MATWKKYFKTYDGKPTSNTSGGPQQQGAEASNKRYNSWLPEFYQGQPNRVQRYGQYDQMDLDSEVNAALDVIAEFSTLNDEYTSLPFSISYSEEPTESESAVLTNSLRQWCNLNELHKRIFKIFRNTIKYGDQVFVRDPETYKLFWVDPAKLEKIVVNEGKGKKPEAYYLKDIDVNLQNLNITADEAKLSAAPSAAGKPGVNINTTQGYGMGGAGAGTRYQTEQTLIPVDANHIVHISLNEGVDGFWPFGISILEPVFKVYKQKELLEDAILIYRVQRAPERRVFYIDVGNMPTHKARQHLERIKNDIHQRRIPSKTGGGQNITDSAYNPLSIMEDYFFAQTAEGRGSKVETLPGGENLGQIDDLRYFNNKLLRGLRVPPSYLGISDADGQGAYNDGRVGSAMIQEFRFTKFCERLQSLIIEQLDNEFKMFCKKRGVQVESSLFSLQFNDPQNFGKFRQAEVDQVAMNVFSSIADAPYMSKRFAMKRFLGLTDDEIVDNEKLWAEENDGGSSSDTGLRDVDAAPAPADLGGGDFDFDDGAEDLEGDGESPISGAENADTDQEA